MAFKTKEDFTEWALDQMVKYGIVYPDTYIDESNDSTPEFDFWNQFAQNEKDTVNE